MTKTEAKPITLVLAVAVTCVVAASGLALTYAVTKDRIAEQDVRDQAAQNGNGNEQVVPVREDRGDEREREDERGGPERQRPALRGSGRPAHRP